MTTTTNTTTVNGETANVTATLTQHGDCWLVCMTACNATLRKSAPMTKGQAARFVEAALAHGFETEGDRLELADHVATYRAWRTANMNAEARAPRKAPIARYRLSNVFVGDYTQQLCPKCRAEMAAKGMNPRRLAKGWASDGTGCDLCLAK